MRGSYQYRERDYAFGNRCLTLRTTLGLTQGALAKLLGVTERAIQSWEGGSSYPKVESLKRFIELGVQRRAFAASHEEEEIRTLWQAAHQRVLLDEIWLHKLLRSSVLPVYDGTSTSVAEQATTFLQESLLTTKFFAPISPHIPVPRPRLSTLLDAGFHRKLTLISAPAGFGKTTLLATWVQSLPKGSPHVAWLSLDAGDNDQVRFWTYVISAFHQLHPSVGTPPLALLHATPPPPIEVVLTTLLNELAQLSTKTVLVLDDYHLVETQPIHDAFTYLVEGLPLNVHLVIASRSDPAPPLPLARLRGIGALSELHAEHLRFTLQESTAFLTEVMGLPLSTEQVVSLEARTEGWIVGLHLAALSMQGREDVSAFIDAFTGSHRYVIDYLVEEVLSRQPENVQEFLLRTSILDRLSAALCDAVRGRDDSQALLAHVERTNLFLVSLDDERQWYRYHHLFAAVLRSHLQQQQPTIIPELHHRASLWYERHELFDEAVTHALAVPDVEHAASLIEQYARFTNFPSQFQSLVSWLNRLPDALVKTHPTLCIMHSLVLMFTNQLEKARGRVQDAEHGIEEGMTAEQKGSILGQTASIRSGMARFTGDMERCVMLGQQALDVLPEAEVIPPILFLRGSAEINVTYTYLVDGDVRTPAERRAEAAVMSARATGNLSVILRSISNLARLQMLQGRLRQAVSTFEQVAELVPKYGGLETLMGSPAYYFGLGDLLRERNELYRAERHLTQGIDLVRGTLTVDAEAATRGYMALARLQQARGESISAFETLDQFTQMAGQCGFVSLQLAHGAAVRAQLELAQGKLAAAIRWAEECDLSTRDDNLVYLHEREYLSLIRVRIAQGQTAPTETFLFDALDLLERLLEDAEAKARISSVLEILILRALAL